MKRELLDYSDMLERYGEEYLQEHQPDDCIYPMDEIEEFITDVWEALRSSFFGYDWHPSGNYERFNPNKDYFAFNAYGNLVSIDAYNYKDWLNAHISEDDFIAYCEDNGYIEEFYNEEYDD